MKHKGFRQSLVWLLITVQLVTIFGCTVTNRVTLPGNEIPVGSNFKINTVTLKDGSVIEFDRIGGMYVEKVRDGKSYRVIAGTTDKQYVEIDPEKVLEVKFEHKETSGTGSFMVGFLAGMPVGAGILLLIALATYSGH